MTDEKGMLLKVGVDASEVAKGVTEVKAGLREMDAAAKTAGPAASPEVTEALKGQAEATNEAAEATEKLGESAGISRMEVMNLAATIGGIDPRLGRLIRTVYRATAALQLLFSPTGLAVGGVVAVVGGLTVAIQKLQEATERAEAAFEKMQQAEDRYRSAAAGREADVGGAMAKAGQPLAALPGARTLAAGLERKGIERSTAVSVAPYLVDETGEPILDEETAFKLAAGVEAGMVKPPEGHTDEQRRRSVTRALRDIERLQGATQNAAEQLIERQARADQAAAAGGLAEIQAIVERETGLTGEEAAARAEKIRRQLREGPETGVTMPFSDQQVVTGYGARLAAKALGGVEKPIEDFDPLVPALHYRGGRAEGAVERFRERTEQPPVVNHFHGPTYVGRPGDRFATRERFPQ